MDFPLSLASTNVQVLTAQKFLDKDLISLSQSLVILSDLEEHTNFGRPPGISLVTLTVPLLWP